MINPSYLNDDFVEPFSKAFRSRGNETFAPFDASVASSVFPVAVWPSFLDEEICEKLRLELAGMEFQLRSSDLYEFHQTTDLKHTDPQKTPLIAQLCNELYSPQFLGAMERITGRRLGSHVDISGQRYQQGDFLLCHDDRLERRRIALILYLVEREAQLEGGRLFALRSDEEGRPVMDFPFTVSPQWNTLAFFEVSRFSFHQVEQVASQNASRYSITCWFHDHVNEDSPVSDSNALTSVDMNSNPHPSDANHLHFTSSLLPIKFACNLPSKAIEDLVTDLDTLGRTVFRELAHARFLSSAQYDIEPSWISWLLCDSFHRSLERLSGSSLDWPTKPVAWCLSSPKHFYAFNTDDKQQDFEYNYKERSVTTNTTDDKLFLTLFIRFPKTAKMSKRKPLRPFFKLHTTPLKIQQLPPKYEKLIIVCMKFNRTLQNLRI